MAEAVSSGKDIACPAWLGYIGGHRWTSSCLVSGRACACSGCISAQHREASMAPQLARAPSKLTLAPSKFPGLWAYLHPVCQPGAVLKCGFCTKGYGITCVCMPVQAFYLDEVQQAQSSKREYTGK